VVENKCDELKDQIFVEAFEYSDVERAMKRLKSGKSTGFDFISSEMLINCKNEKMLLIFQIIFNYIFKNGLKLKNMRKIKLMAILMIIDPYQCQILIVYYMRIFYWKKLRMYFNLAKINLDIEEQHLVIIQFTSEHSE
jgi:hypothetical protein